MPDPTPPRQRPRHPRWPAFFLLLGVSLLLVGLAVLSTFGGL